MAAGEDPASGVPTGMTRKLAAILSADVAGYSRLMGEDEEATIHTLKLYRSIINTVVQQHRGRVVDSPGDNLLAEFPSAVDAVTCALRAQEALSSTNDKLPEMRRLNYSDRLACGTLAAGGTLGILVPPSVILIIYALLAQQSIVKLFAAAVIPGLIAALGR